jgi:F0F1-type ATP synthase epsilon subunit
MALLGSGTLTVRSGTAIKSFRVQGGFLQVVSNTVRVVAEHVQGEEHAA